MLMRKNNRKYSLVLYSLHIWSDLTEFYGKRLNVFEIMFTCWSIS